MGKRFALLLLALAASSMGAQCPLPPTTARAANETIITQCAEEDNCAVWFGSPVSGFKSFVVEATHPTYEVETSNCEPNFANCPPPETGYPFTPGVFKLFDNGITVVEAVRESLWWRPNGMTLAAENGAPVSDIHYVRLYRKIAGANEWPQVLVLYMDGNLRLIPQPPVGFASVCFGSSVLIGPALPDVRPIAEIALARYYSGSDAVQIVYKSRALAVLNMLEVNRDRTRVRVSLYCPTNTLPFAVFRSMYVSDGNADVDHVRWKDTTSNFHEETIKEFGGGQAREWLFHRLTYSNHNNSAPDIRLIMGL